MSSDRGRTAAARQQQFLSTVSREEAIDRFQSYLELAPLGTETVLLADASGRILARDAVAAVDVPGFDRANVDGFAVRAADVAGASADLPRRLDLTGEVITPGRVPAETVGPGQATVIATGGMIPRGADAVVMVEHTDSDEDGVEILQPIAPGAFVTYAGSDIALGETVLYGGQPLGSREIGLLAAVGWGEVPVYRRPRVAIVSTGDELVEPGAPARPGGVYDSNAAILSAAVTELGCEPWPLGIVADEEATLTARLAEALTADAVLLSGGTSKGAGDVAHRVVSRLDDPGIVVHGVAVKPGKPLCLAVAGGRPVVVLPGFPTSAIFTFHEFVAPVLRALAGLAPQQRATVTAKVPMALPSELGRTEYRMVWLVQQPDGEPAAYPSPKGSGAVTSFSRADGFMALDAGLSGVVAGSTVSVQLIDPDQQAADLIAIGSHCTGLDYLLGRLRHEGYAVKSLHVGSQGGLEAARRGECDIAGVHLLDLETGSYNAPFVPPEVRLVRGYGRQQGICYRPDDTRFMSASADTLFPALVADDTLVMINRNAGSGTRLLLDSKLDGAKPAGYDVQPSSHNAVAAAVAQGRADWGMTIAPVAAAYGLGFVPVRDESYDLLIPESRWQRPAVMRLQELLADDGVRTGLAELGFSMTA